MTYIDVLTPEERLWAIRLGAMKKLAASGISPSEFGSALEKAAAEGNGMPGGLSLKGLLLLATGIGIPVGAVTYALRSAFTPDKNKNKKLKAQLDEYNDIVGEYRESLGQT